MLPAFALVVGVRVLNKKFVPTRVRVLVYQGIFRDDSFSLHAATVSTGIMPAFHFSLISYFRVEQGICPT